MADLLKRHLLERHLKVRGALAEAELGIPSGSSPEWWFELRRNSSLAADDALRPAVRLRSRVAAVCYRRGERGVELVLVRTGAGRWTFPKGSVEAGETERQAALREAAEEAGVSGSIETRPFATFPSVATDPKSGVKVELTVTAFLLEVHDYSDTHERHRAPTWFTPKEAKSALAAGRAMRYARALEHAVDVALARLGAS